MSRKKRVILSYECIMYLSTEGDIFKADYREKKQEKYIREYAKAHGIIIAGSMHRDALGMKDVDEHFRQMAKLISNNRVQGVIVANMKAVSRDVIDAYHKVGLINMAGGVMISVDEGLLKLGLKEEVYE